MKKLKKCKCGIKGFEHIHPGGKLNKVKVTWNCHTGYFHQVGCPHEERLIFEANEKTSKVIKEFEDFTASLLDKHFPKKHCKERSQAFVFNAEVCLYFRHLIRSL